jgi:micrococcal nuclease
MVRVRTTLLLALLALTLRTVTHSAPPVEVRKNDQVARKVLKVVDGDTLLLSPAEKVRLIGVNTPETIDPRKAVECYGKEASEFTRKMVEGKTVRLELDDAYAKRHHKDRYDRTLAYVYLENGTLLNSEIIRQGYGRVFSRYKFRYRDQFRTIQRQAQDEKLGVWFYCPKNNYPFSLSRNLSASMAAMQPVPAAVTACR